MSSSVSNVRNRFMEPGIGSCSINATTSRSLFTLVTCSRTTRRQMHDRREGWRTISRRWLRNCSIAGFFPGRSSHFSSLSFQPAFTRKAATCNSLYHVSQQSGEFLNERLKESHTTLQYNNAYPNDLNKRVDECFAYF